MRRLLLHFDRSLAGWRIEASETSSHDEITDILREVEDAMSSLERARKALREGST